MLADVWYVLLAGMLAVYVILDGFDLGAGMLHLFVAKTNAERNVGLHHPGAGLQRDQGRVLEEPHAGLEGAAPCLPRCC